MRLRQSLLTLHAPLTYPVVVVRMGHNRARHVWGGTGLRGCGASTQ